MAESQAEETKPTMLIAQRARHSTTHHADARMPLVLCARLLPQACKPPSATASGRLRVHLSRTQSDPCRRLPHRVSERRFDLWTCGYPRGEPPEKKYSQMPSNDLQGTIHRPDESPVCGVVGEAAGDKVDMWAKLRVGLARAARRSRMAPAGRVTAH